MKTFALLLLFQTLLFDLKSQEIKLSGAWYSKKQDYIEFDSSYCTIQNGFNLSQNDFTICKRFGQELFLLSEYYDPQNIDSLRVDYNRLFHLRIKKQTDNSIILEFISKSAKVFFDGRCEIEFFRERSFTDTSIKFNKLTFRAGNCFGDCPILDLQVDEKGSILYDGYGNSDTRLNGSFSGTIPRVYLDTLVYLLQNCQLKTLKWSPTMCCDGPIVTLIIYYNGARKRLKSMMPARISSDLVSFLYTINSKSILSLRNSKVDFED